MKSTTIQYGLSAPAVSTIIRKPLVNIKGTTSVRFVLSGFEDIFNPAVKLEVLWGDTTAKTNFFRPLAYNYKTQSILNEVIYGELAGTLFAHYDHVFDNNTSSYNYPLTSQFLVTFKNGKTVYIYQPLNIFKGSFYDDIANLDILNTQITPTSSNNTVINFESSNDQTYIAVLRNGASQTFDNTDYSSICIPTFTLVIDRVWTGLGADNNWSTSNNWSSNTIPVPNITLYFGSAARYAPNNNLAANTSYKSIIFNNDAGAYTITGNSFTLYSLTGGIANNSTNLQTITNNIDIVGTGGITFNCNTAGINLSGVISGTNSLIKTGTNALTLGGLNTYSGGTNINAGTIKLGNLRALGADNTSCNIAAGATLDLNNIQQLRQIAFTGSGVITNTLAGNQRSLFCGHSSVNAIFTGNIVQPPSTGSIAVTKTGANTQTFSGLNNSTGQVRVSGGTLEFSNIIDGVARDILFGSALPNTTFRYIGSSAASVLSRRISIDGAATNAILDSSGIGTFTIGGAEINTSTSGPKTLVLQGSNTGSNIIGHSTSHIINGLNVLSIVKAGTGKWVFGSQNNTYTGSTSITSGTLVSVKGTASAEFTPTQLTVTFSTPPSIGATFSFFPGSTVQSYSPVTLIGAPGRTGTYNSTNSTLTIA